MKNNLYIILVSFIPFFVDCPFTSSQLSYVVVIIIGILAYQKICISKMVGFAQAILFLIITALFRTNQYNTFFFKDLGLMFLGVFPFIFNPKFKINTRALNILMFIGFVISIWSNFFEFKISKDSFLESDFGIEIGAYTYTFGLLILYWIQKKNFVWALINLPFLFLGGKRIAMISIIICVCLGFLLLRRKGKVPFFIKSLFLVSVLLLLYFIYQFSMNKYDDFIMNYFGISADALVMGRQQFYAVIFSIIQEPNYWGIGPGNTIIPLYSEFEETRIHNDFLKIYAENGICIYLCFFFLFFRDMKWEQIPTIIFILSLFMTTNTLIYVYMIFMYCLFLSSNNYLQDVPEHPKK